MKKLKIAFLGVIFLMFMVSAQISAQSWHESHNLLSAAINIAKSTTATRGTDFTSSGVRVSTLGYSFYGAITLTFTRAAGSTSNVTVKFEVSYDDGTTWSTFENADFSVPTNQAVISGTTVRVTKLYNFCGISHIRVKSIQNSDASNNITAVQVIFSQ